MRPTAVMLVAALAVSGCGGTTTADPPVTASETVAATDSPDTKAEPEPTTTTLAVTTSEAHESTTTSSPPIMGGVVTRHEDGCSYEGRTEFDVNSDVTFTFVNASEVLNASFVVWIVNEGTTAEDIYELGIFAVSDEDSDGYEPYLPTPGNPPGSENSITVTLDRIGLHALLCFHFPEGDPYYANLFTVNE